MDRELPELNTVIRTFANEGEAHIGSNGFIRFAW